MNEFFYSKKKDLDLETELKKSCCSPDITKMNTSNRKMQLNSRNNYLTSKRKVSRQSRDQSLSGGEDRISSSSGSTSGRSISNGSDDATARPSMSSQIIKDLELDLVKKTEELENIKDKLSDR